MTHRYPHFSQDQPTYSAVVVISYTHHGKKEAFEGVCEVLHEHAWRNLLGNNNPSLKMSPVLICTHNLQTSKCLLSINIFIRSSILLPLVLHPGSKHSECQETPLTQSQQGMGFGKGHFQVPAGSQQLSLTAARDLAPSSRLLAWRLFP